MIIGQYFLGDGKSLPDLKFGTTLEHFLIEKHGILRRAFNISRTIALFGNRLIRILQIPSSPGRTSTSLKI